MNNGYVVWHLDKIIPGESLPAPLYLFLSQRFVVFRDKGQILDRAIFDRLELKRIRDFFIKEEDRASFEAWSGRFPKGKTESVEAPEITPAEQASAESIRKVRKDAQRSVADIFHSFHTDANVTQVLTTSNSLVEELTKSPLITQPLMQLQTLSRSTADHSVNVSILSVYLALNMGYSHMVILRHLATGGLLHDIGKIDALKIEESDPAGSALKLKEHPLIGETMVSSDESISREVKMIIAQHHECHDGSGYPKGLKGNEIYDLARIVAIANVFDDLVANGKGSLAERQKHALAELEGPLSSKFHPMKLKKVIKILSLGI